MVNESYQPLEVVSAGQTCEVSIVILGQSMALSGQIYMGSIVGAQ